MATFTNSSDFFTTAEAGDTCTERGERSLRHYIALDVRTADDQGKRTVIFDQVTTCHHSNSKQYSFTYATELTATTKGGFITRDLSGAMQRTRALMAPVSTSRFNAKTMGEHHDRAVEAFHTQILSDAN